MKKMLLFIALVLTINVVQAQPCSKLFISKYAEGYSNNRAVEIYNPTPNAVDLGLYSIGRFRNGGDAYDPQPLPSVMLQPYDTYLAVIDKRDSLGTCFEIPVWNGYQLWDTCIDQSTGMPILDTAGNVIFCVQYENVTCSSGDIPHHRYGTEYNAFLDLESRADSFFNPVYVSGGSTPMYFNGDDAVALVEGTSISTTGDNILDVIGVIGEDPGEAWSTWSGYWITKDRTIVRHPDIQEGILAAATLGDTMAYADWTIYPKNTFYVIDGGHECICDPNYVSTKTVNQIDFKLYPNPATSGHVMIEAEAPIQEVSISNMIGQTIETLQFNNNSVREEVRFRNVDTGLYLVTIRFKDNSITTRKLMIQ